MYDSITVSTVPNNPQAVAGYVGGNWPTYNSLVGKFPHAHHLSVAVNASEDAECLDVEAGDAVNAQAPAWVRRQIARGVQRPVVYTSASNAVALLNTLAAAGIRRPQVRLWTAHYTKKAHICGPNEGFGSFSADATQFTDTSLGRNLDESLCSNDFFGVAPLADPNNYLWFPVGPFVIGGKKLNERAVVQAYDSLRDHLLSKIIPNRPALKVLRKQLQGLAERVDQVATQEKGKPTWDLFHRGWRFQQLIHRAQGERVAK